MTALSTVHSRVHCNKRQYIAYEVCSQLSVGILTRNPTIWHCNVVVLLLRLAYVRNILNKPLPFGSILLFLSYAMSVNGPILLKIDRLQAHFSV